jgi:precorrin-6A synthase
MKKVLIIGIGAGDPGHVTMQAIEALNTVDVFFVLDKGPAKEKLTALRKEVCRRYVKRADFRVVEARSPPRDPAPADYAAAVDALNRDKQEVFEDLIVNEMADGETAAILAWGDPALYDSTIRNLEAVAERVRGLEYRVIPGVSSIAVLAARHRITLNRIGRPVEITTGRRLREGLPAHDVVVMLDGEDAYMRFADSDDLEIFWGAYLGTPDEILIAGKLRDVAPEIKRRRAEARRANGWIMDTYLIRHSH